jgi:hypothetical protein
MSSSKANASWDAPLSTEGRKLSRNATAALIHVGLIGVSSSSEETSKRLIDASTSTDQLRRKLNDSSEITQLLSMLRSNTFVGAVHPDDHAHWFQTISPESKRQKLAMTC